MPLSFDGIAGLAVELQSGLSGHDRFSRIIHSIHHLFKCDATALLRYENLGFRPLATAGLAPDVMGRRFSLDAHPRLEAIARAGDVVRFPADSDLPDPYDGLIPDSAELHIHACVGLPLFYGQTLIGALTLDAVQADHFATFRDRELRFVANLAGTALNNALLLEQLEKNTTSFAALQREHNESSVSEIIGESATMLQLNKEISIVAPSDLNVLITGETGTGKELVAQAIHQQSTRKATELIYLNCAALPETVAESELFGHVKGAFTGAVHKRAGKFERADNGTLFLDEIGELPIALQAKLLRVLQYGDLQRVGEDRALKVDVRIIAATNKDLKQAVVDGIFRADLYHRLSVFPLHVPALRDRSEDVILLAGFFSERCRIKFGLKRISLNASVRSLLMSYDWPGNVLELEHTIYRAAIIARADSSNNEIELMPSHFSFPAGRIIPVAETAQPPLPVKSLQEATREFQREYISRVFNANGKKWANCARLLEVDPGNLHRQAKRLGIK